MQERIKRDDVLDIAQYETARPGFRDKVLALKEDRRVFVGEHFHFMFENRATVLYQIQEMMRVERIVEEKAILHEVATYNELLPAEGGLAATLMLEYAEASQRARFLPGLVGIENHVWLKIADLALVQAVFDTSQIGEARISSVQYMRFPLTETHRARWAEAAGAGQVVLLVDHPRYRAETLLSPAVAAALAEDFR